MKQARAIQYTIRGVPAELDEALRRKAAKRKLSLNQAILEELTACTTGAKKKADFSDLVGRWKKDDAFDEVIAAPRQIDWEKWK